MKTEKIVIEGSDMTSIEKDLAMLHQIEKILNTGPIIGEARDVILALSRNLLIRDLFISTMGISEKEKERIFQQANDFMEENDKKILKTRKTEKK